jgi:hypothetical protein
MTIPKWQVRKEYEPSAGNGACIKQSRSIPIVLKKLTLSFASPLEIRAAQL